MNRFMSKISSVVISLTLFSSSFINIKADENKELDSLKSKYIVLMDYDSGKILYRKNADKKLYPASTTKIWTAFCVLERSNDLNEVIEIKNLPEIEGTSMSLKNGEKFSVYQLLQSLLINSSNDVAHVLATHFGKGNDKEFINFMNSEAKKYGAKNTHFTNPHGLPDENHYTTAEDMAVLSRVAYSNDIIRKIVATKEVKYKANATSEFDRIETNSNKFLTSSQSFEYKGKNIPIKYDIIDGIKTGFTDDAGNCLVATGSKNGVRLISGVFFAPSGSLYHDSRTILDYGFDNFKTTTIFNKESFHGEKSVKFAKPGKIKYTLANDFTVTALTNKEINKDDYNTKYDFSALDLPVKKGDVIGTLNIFEKNNMVSSIALIAENDSQSYIDYLMNLLPFTKKEKDKIDKTTDENKEIKSEDEKSNKEEKTDNVKEDETSSEVDKKDSNVVSKISEKGNDIKLEANKSAQGILGFLHSIKDGFRDIFSGGFISSLENTSLYKFLEGKISEKITFIPAKLIIFGVPLLIFILVFLLIIGIIVDAFKSRKRKDEDEY